MGTLSDYERYDGLGLAELVASKQVTAQELLDAAIERVEQRNPMINAVINRLYDQARAAIARGLPPGPFTGVPYLLKDMGIQYAGAVTANGSQFFRDAVADHDSEIVARLKRAGLVIFGKTNTPELGLSTSTEPRLFGPTRNPWNREYSSGGSSGGAAAAVAAGMLPMAHATDGAGSIRIPASMCGLFGLKPTRARTPAGPDLGENWNGASLGHAITRSVRDSAALLDATAGPEIGDPYWAPPPSRPFLAEVGVDPGALKIAVTTRAWNGQPTDPECAAAVAAAAKLCEQLGHHVADARPEWHEEARVAATQVIIAASVRAVLEERAERVGRAVSAQDVEPRTWSVAQSGREKSASDYARAIRAIHRMGRALGNFFRSWDLLLTPTMCRPPHKLGVLSIANPDNDSFLQALIGTIAFTSPFNSSGHPAMTVPLHYTKDRLPVGVQFVARFGDEATLIRLAAQLERAQPWAANFVTPAPGTRGPAAPPAEEAGPRQSGRKRASS